MRIETSGAAQERHRKATSEAGATLFALSCFGFGLVEAALEKPLPELHPWALGGHLSIVVGVALMMASLGIFAARLRKGASACLALMWLIGTAACVAAALHDPKDLTGWVPAFKSAVFTLASIFMAARSGTLFQACGTALRLMLGLTLIYFGIVHIVDHALVASLIPTWIPAAANWPFVTGSSLLAIGLSLILDAFVSLCVLTMCLEFGGWIALIHIPNLYGNPKSGFQWEFALGALALIGCALLLPRRDKKSA
jgi:uncharacterized membrane protein